MSQRREYRSAVRSRRLIRQAFLELLREKKFEKITVTDIVARADINRSTFYAHYPDVRGLVEEIMDEIIDHSMTLVKEIRIQEIFTDPVPFLKELTDIGVQNAELYTLLSRSDFALRQIEQIKATFLENAVSAVDIPEHIRNSEAFRVQINFFVGGILSTYQQWLQGTLNCSIDEIIRQIASLIQNNAQVYETWK